MMVSEFIERTGFEPTASEYKEIEAEYMGTGADKEKFCKDWKKNSGPQRLMRLRARKIEEQAARKEAEEKLEKVREAFAVLGLVKEGEKAAGSRCDGVQFKPLDKSKRDKLEFRKERWG